MNRFTNFQMMMMIMSLVRHVHHRHVEQNSRMEKDSFKYQNKHYYGLWKNHLSYLFVRNKLTRNGWTDAVRGILNNWLDPWNNYMHLLQKKEATNHFSFPILSGELWPLFLSQFMKHEILEIFSCKILVQNLMLIYKLASWICFCFCWTMKNDNKQT